MANLTSTLLIGQETVHHPKRDDRSVDFSVEASVLHGRGPSPVDKGAFIAVSKITHTDSDVKTTTNLPPAYMVRYFISSFANIQIKDVPIIFRPRRKSVKSFTEPTYPSRVYRL